MQNARRITPGPGQESVWDYPRPPRIESVTLPITVEHAGRLIAQAGRSVRILETSHPPVYYLPLESFAPGTLQPNDRTSFCEYKGTAHYWDLVADGRISVRDVGWSYPHPAPPYAALKDHIALYASRVEACFVGGERVVPQAGDFYGGWITSTIVGPFKGPTGTRGW